MKPDHTIMTAGIDKPQHENNSVRPEATELWLVAGVVALAVVLRCAHPSRLAVEQFDEGVYASNIWFGGSSGFQYPDQHLYAPPLLPETIYTLFTLAGPSNLGAMVPSLLAGVLTIPLVWWVGRQWFGTTAGLASASLAALSDLHILFSRSALTDALLCFWLLAAVYLGWLAMHTARRRAIIAAGVATSLAWWTKYSGWLPLAICGAGLIPWLVVPLLGRTRRSLPAEAAATSDSFHALKHERGPGQRLLRGGLGWLMMAGIAAALWSPFLWSLGGKGGYAAVHKNHSGYLVGWSGWWDSAWQQFSNLGQIEGVPSFNGPLLAVVLAVLYRHLGRRGFTWNGLDDGMVFPVIAIWSVFSYVFTASFMLAIVAISWGLTRFAILVRDVTAESNWRPSTFAGWILAAWFIGLAVTTPLYTPYPRLMLPWTVATWLSAGAALGRLSAWLHKSGAGESEPQSREQVRLRRLAVGWLPRTSIFSAAVGLVLAGLIFGDVVLAYVVGTPAWHDRTSIARLADVVGSDVRHDQAGVSRPGDSAVIYTFGEPALLFQLRLLGWNHVNPIQDLDFATQIAPSPVIPSYVVIGRQARNTPGFGSRFAAARDRLELVASHTVDPSLLVRLDDRGTDNPLPGENRGEPYVWDLYRVR